jgi:hypothetical protein
MGTVRALIGMLALPAAAIDPFAGVFGQFEGVFGE